MPSKNPIAVLCADLHLREDQPLARTDDYQDTQWNKFRFLLEAARENNIPILCAGDIFNKARVSKEFEKKIVRIIEQHGVTFFAIPGNHDLPYHNLKNLDDSSLGILELSENVKLFPVELDTIYIENYFNFKIGMIHSLIHRDNPIVVEGKTISSKAKTFLKKNPDLDVILSGDNHEHFVEEFEGRLLINPGSMMRMKASQIAHKPCFLLLYSDLSYETIYYPIKKGVLNREHIDVKEKQEERMNKFIQKITGKENISVSFEDNLYNYIKANKIRKPVEALIQEAIE
jgi:DNA repair exonuclease SbcCD nuclease subunit